MSQEPASPACRSRTSATSRLPSQSPQHGHFLLILFQKPFCNCHSAGLTGKGGKKAAAGAPRKKADDDDDGGVTGFNRLPKEEKDYLKLLYASHFPVETFPDATSVSDKDLFPYIQAGSRYLKEKGHEINLLGWAKRKKERQGKNGPAVRKRTTQTPNMPDAKRRKVEAPPTTPVPAGKANQPEPKGSPKPQELEGDNGEILDEYAAQNRLSDASWMHWTDEEILTVARHALPDLKSAKSVAGCKLLLSLSAKGNTALLNAIAEGVLRKRKADKAKKPDKEAEKKTGKMTNKTTEAEKKTDKWADKTKKTEEKTDKGPYKAKKTTEKKTDEGADKEEKTNNGAAKDSKTDKEEDGEKAGKKEKKEKKRK